jgi:hypothetical protein
LKFEDKIMRNVLKEVHIDKSTSLTIWSTLSSWHTQPFYPIIPIIFKSNENLDNNFE